MIETLFGYGATDKGKKEQKKDSSSQDPSPQFIQIIDPKKSQNLAILLRALNMTIEEVCDALHEGKTSFLFFLKQCNAIEQTYEWIKNERLYEYQDNLNRLVCKQFP